MLDFISWTQFFAATGVLTLVWILYTFKNDIMGRGRPGKSPPAKRVWQVSESSNAPYAAVNEPGYDDTAYGDGPDQATAQEQEETDAHFSALEILIDELQEIIAASEPAIDKTALLASMQPVIARYPALDQPAFKAVVHNFISQAAAKTFNMAISKKETEALWQRVLS